MKFWQWLISVFSRRPVPNSGPVGPPNDLITLINVSRLNLGRSLLTADSKLTSLAQRWAETMAKSNVLTHGDFRGRISLVFPNVEAAENIAGGLDSEDKVIQTWLASPGHRTNIMGPYERIGVGRAGQYWVADFLA